MLPLLIGLIVLGIVVAAAGILSMAVRIDAAAAGEKRAMIEQAVASQVATQGQVILEYSRWDDAVAHLYGTPDAAWAAGSLGVAYQFFVLDRLGRIVFTSQVPEGWHDPAVDPNVPAVHAALRAMQAALPVTPAAAMAVARGKTAIVYDGRTLIVMSAAPIVPMHDAAAIRLPLRTIVMVRRIDAPILADWRRQFAMSDLRIAAAGAAAKPDAERTSMPIVDQAGRAIAVVSFDRVHPGRRAVDKMAPWLAIALVLYALLSGTLAAMLVSTGQALASQRRQAEHAADEARRHAEAMADARALAQAAHDRAAQAAAREVEERRRHAEALRTASHGIADTLERSMRALVQDLFDAADALDRSAGATIDALAAQNADAEQAIALSQTAAGAVHTMAADLGRLVSGVDLIGEHSATAGELVASADRDAARAWEANDRLLKEIAAIGEAATLISRIAAQTDLLALNATLEAARAGDAGTGFKIVAHEVKALAAAAAQTSVEIQRLVGAVADAGGSTVAAVQAVHHSMARARQTTLDIAARVEEQRASGGAIRGSSSAVDRDTASIGQAVTLISNALRSATAATDTTRTVGGEVRRRAERLTEEFGRVVVDLRAA